ncbi:hypothetical protein L218DRAFT_859725 [Marasmius fiardii PR-910]|nr:hypothetical protein L218DRAFT_859725 [Marasmius fiardii PR-910]
MTTTITANPFIENRVRVLFFVQKKDDISFQEWSRYWSHEHAQIFIDLEITKKNILKYEQLHVNQEWKERLGQYPQVKVPDFDGIVIMEGESLEKITEVSGKLIQRFRSLDVWCLTTKVVQHPDYLDKVISDGRSKLFKLENIVHGGFDIATILEKSSKDARIKAEVGGNIRKDIARVLIPLRRKKGLSQVQFDQYWLNTHAPLMEKFLLATSVSKYEQVNDHIPLATLRNLTWTLTTIP